MKKTNKNNKGFSLVELIVVIAIMAILVGVIGPQLLKQIEKSRVSKDETRMDDVYTAVKTALADEEFNQAFDTLMGEETSITYDDIENATGNAFADDVLDTVGTLDEFTSNDYEDAGYEDIVFTLDANNNIIMTVTGDEVYTLPN